MTDPIEEARARLLAHDEGYRVHIGCGGEVDARTMLCARCDEAIGAARFAHPGDLSDCAANDVRSFAAEVDRLRSSLAEAESKLSAAEAYAAWCSEQHREDMAAAERRLAAVTAERDDEREDHDSSVATIARLQAEKAALIAERDRILAAAVQHAKDAGRRTATAVDRREAAEAALAAVTAERDEAEKSQRAHRAELLSTDAQLAEVSRQLDALRCEYNLERSAHNRLAKACERERERAKVAESALAAAMEAMPSERVCSIIRDVHRDDGGDSGYPGEVCMWLDRLDAFRASQAETKGDSNG